MFTLQEARFMRSMRLKLDWKQEYVAHKLNVSVALYGEIERNQSQPSNEVLINIKKLFNFASNIDLEKCRNDLKELYYSIYYCKENSECLFNLLKKQRNKYENSILFIDYYLIIYIYKVTKIKKVDRYFKILKSWERYLTVSEKEFFVLYQCVQLRNEDNVIKAIQTIKEMLINKLSNKYAHAMLCYHAAPIYYGLGNLVESYKMTMLGEDLFKETFCEARFLMLKSQEGNIYMMSKLHEQADLIYNDILIKGKEKLLEIDYNIIICNASWNMIQIDNYQKALYYLSLRTPISSELPYFHFNYTWVLYKTDNKETLNYIKENIDKVKDLYLKRTMNIVEWLIIDPLSSELIKRLKECEKYLYKTSTDQDGFLFINNLILEYYQRKGNKQQLIKYMKKRLELK